jgi:Fe-S oxidoreductase
MRAPRRQRDAVPAARAALVETLNGSASTRIVTCDPHAFNTLKNEYPDFGGHYEVVHHTQLIARLIAEGRCASAGVRARHLPRALLPRPPQRRIRGAARDPRAAHRDAPLEFRCAARRRCAAAPAGARMWMEEKIGRRINIARFEQALPQQPRVIATACPYCATMMSDAAKAHPGEPEIATRDIAELVAEALTESGAS